MCGRARITLSTESKSNKKKEVDQTGKLRWSCSSTSAAYRRIRERRSHVFSHLYRAWESNRWPDRIFRSSCAEFAHPTHHVCPQWISSWLLNEHHRCSLLLVALEGKENQFIDLLKGWFALRSSLTCTFGIDLSAIECMWSLLHKFIDRLRICESDKSEAPRLTTLILHDQRIADLTEFCDVFFQCLIGRSRRTDGSLLLFTASCCSNTKTQISSGDSLERQTTDKQFAMLFWTSTVS